MNLRAINIVTNSLESTFTVQELHKLAATQEVGVRPKRRHMRVADSLAHWD